MGRILFFLILLAVAWIAVKRLNGGSGRPTGGTPGDVRKPEPMLACSLCKLHVPQSDGVERDGAFYCCEAHARRADDRGAP